MASGLALLASAARGGEPPHDVTFSEDFNELWATLRDRYCYFAEKQTDWDKVRAVYRPAAIGAASPDAFLDVVRRVLAELYDAHTHLASPPDNTPRWPLYDLCAEMRGDAAYVVAVEDGSAAADAGLAPGDRIVAADGVTMRELVGSLLPRCMMRPDEAAERYAVNVAVAGRRGQDRRLTVQTASGRGLRTVLLAEKASLPLSDVEFKPMADGLGYIRISSFAETEAVARFDRALESLRDARGLILDVRQNGGGDTAVARPMMGRFVRERTAYARMRRRSGAGLSEAWTEFVDPVGPFTFTRPVVVLTSHWSGSMAEGFPMGMRDIGRGRIVGTAMMGLGAAVFPITLDRTGIQAQYSAEPVYDTHDQPRSRLQPDVVVPPGADVLAAGLAELRRLTPS